MFAGYSSWSALLNKRKCQITGIIAFISKTKFILSWSVQEKSFITLGPTLRFKRILKKKHESGRLVEILTKYSAASRFKWWAARDKSVNENSCNKGTDYWVSGVATTMMLIIEFQVKDKTTLLSVSAANDSWCTLWCLSFKQL